MELPAPAQYFPIRNGRYDVAPALRPFGASFGNGVADEQVFQLDAELADYRANKLECRAGRPGKHVATEGLEPPVAAAVARLLIDRLHREHPEWFTWSPEATGGGRLHCALTGDTLDFDGEMRLAAVAAKVDYSDALDALACQIQEDLAVVCQAPDGTDRLAAYHICAPSHWSPEEKHGRGFAAIHAPVPGMAAVNSVAGSMVEAMIHRGPFVRFVWGLDTDRRLNRHPEPPEGVDALDWQSPPFDPTAPAPVMFRVERQVTWGMPEVSAALFVIRPYLSEGFLVRDDPAKRAALRSAVGGMSPASRAYKGITSYADALLRWLG
jgi:hypothetical protein